MNGVVTGSNLAGLRVVVTDEKKRELLRHVYLKEEIAAAYGSRPRSEMVTVPFDLRIPGAELSPATRTVEVKLIAVNDAGTTSTVSFREKKALSLF